MDMFMKALHYQSIYEWAKTLHPTEMTRIMVNALPAYGALLVNAPVPLPSNSVFPDMSPLDLSIKNKPTPVDNHSFGFESSGVVTATAAAAAFGKPDPGSPTTMLSVSQILSTSSVSPASRSMVSSSEKRKSPHCVSRSGGVSKRSSSTMGQQLRRGCSKVQTCNQCLEKFYSTKDLDVHTFSIHDTYRCTFENCNVTFTQRSNLNRHGMGHMKGDPIHCKICWRGFKRKDHCVKHLQEKHTVTEECGDFVHSRIPTARSLEAIGLFNGASSNNNSITMSSNMSACCTQPVSTTTITTPLKVKEEALPMEEEVIDVVN